MYSFLQALCFASWKGYVHIVKVLLSHGADAHMATLDGQKACDLAFSQGYKMVTITFKKYLPPPLREKESHEIGPVSMLVGQ